MQGLSASTDSEEEAVNPTNPDPASPQVGEERHRIASWREQDWTHLDGRAWKLLILRDEDGYEWCGWEYLQAAEQRIARLEEALRRIAEKCEGDPRNWEVPEIAKYARRALSPSEPDNA